MDRVAIIEDDQIVNIVMASADWVDPNGRETIPAPMEAGLGIGAQRQPDGSWAMPVEPLTEEETRNQRNAFLAESDWTQVADATVDQAAWATYRQALRDVPNQADFPQTVTWPVKP